MKEMRDECYLNFFANHAVKKRMSIEEYCALGEDTIKKQYLERHVALSKIPIQVTFSGEILKYATVSTVGLVSSLVEDSVYESMAFVPGSPGNPYQTAKTWEEAERVHKVMCGHVIAEFVKEQIGYIEEDESTDQDD